MVLAAELLERLRPFVYRRYIDFGTLQSLRSLKAVMAQEVARKGMEHSVKHGRAGSGKSSSPHRRFRWCAAAGPPRCATGAC